MQWDFLSQSRAALKWVRWIMKSVLLWRFIVKAGALLTLSMIYKVHRDWAWTSSAQDSLFICVNWAQLSLPCVALGKKHHVCDDQQRQSQRCHVRWWEKGERRGDVLTPWGQIPLRTWEVLCHIQPCPHGRRGAVSLPCPFVLIFPPPKSRVFTCWFKQ